MPKFKEAEMIPALYAASVVIVKGMIDQGAIDREQLVKYVENVAKDDLLPAFAFVLGNWIKHLRQPDPVVRPPTLQ